MWPRSRAARTPEAVPDSGCLNRDLVCWVGWKKTVLERSHGQKMGEGNLKEKSVGYLWIPPAFHRPAD